ncbi:MAG: hypothetical protein IPG02_02445 [Ignavibacteria bacterium]|nr:hypothetical protein [Ignavibacteria bacterium]
MKLWDKLFGKSESNDDKEKNTKLDDWAIYNPDEISAQFISKLKGVRDVISKKLRTQKLF